MVLCLVVFVLAFLSPHLWWCLGFFKEFFCDFISFTVIRVLGFLSRLLSICISCIFVKSYFLGLLGIAQW